MKRLFNERLAMAMVIAILLVVSCVAVGTLGETVAFFSKAALTIIAVIAELIVLACHHDD